MTGLKLKFNIRIGILNCNTAECNGDGRDWDSFAYHTVELLNIIDNM